MLLDEVLSLKKPRLIADRHWNLLQSVRHQARRYVFTPTASEILGDFAMGSGDLVVAHRQFALPPYPVTYVELNAYNFFSYARKMNIVLANDTSGTATDHTLGYLTVGRPNGNFFVYVFAGGAKGRQDHDFDGRLLPHKIVSPIYYDIGMARDFPRFALDGNQQQMLAILLGTTALTEDAQEAASAILSQAAANLAVTKEFGDRINSGGQTSMMKLLQGSAGDVRNIWAALLWLGQPSRIIIKEMPAERRVTGGKLVAYAKHNVVDIDLGRHRVIRRAYLQDAPRTPPRRHEVSGYWQHYGGLATGCTHSWPLMPDIDGKWHCQNCGRVRFRVNDYMRGDASRGFVTKDYRVKADGQ
jgi:hypothetical protein